VPEALLFSFEMATADTPVAGVKLVVKPVPVAAWFQMCGAERELSDMTKKVYPTAAFPRPN
jgi:Zn finger protein HypA/HybF involved in hydrogenase expression